MRTFYLIIFYLIAARLPRSRLPGGKFSRKIRYLLAKKLFKKCGRDVNVEDHCYIGRGKNIEIDDYSGIGPKCEIHGPVKIGKYVLMGSEVLINIKNHNHQNIKKPMFFQGLEADKKVIIEDNVWIGTRAIILPGVKIGKGSIIGAGSVVSRDIPSYSLAVGAPARVVKKRR